MKESRRWLVFVLGGVAVFIAFNFFVWTVYTKDILTDNVKSGDYTRVGFIIGSAYSEKPAYQPSQRHVEGYEYSGGPIDIITIGDSFSNSCGKKGLFYQDWLVAERGLTVLNIQRLPGADFFETAVILVNSGVMDELRPKAVLIQRVERHVYDCFAKDFNMRETRPAGDVWKWIREARYTNAPPAVNFLNVGNLKFLLYGFLRQFNDHAFFSKVYARELKRPLFSVLNNRFLIWGYEDVSHLAAESSQAVLKINDKFNALAEMMSKRGIKLFFMPVVDKYNLYSSELVRNPYPKSRFFEMMRRLPKKYGFIDTKAALAPLVARGVLDVYWADDSHWSWPSAERVMRSAEIV